MDTNLHDTDKSGEALENYETSLLVCDEIQAIVPNLYYYLSYLKTLDKHFGNNPQLAEVVQELLSLASLESIRSNVEDYVTQYRELLTDTLMKLQALMSTVPNPDSFSPAQNKRLLATLRHLFDQQEKILQVLEG